MTRLRVLSRASDAQPDGLPSRYRYRQTLAVGRLASILRVADTVLGRDVVMKVLRPERVCETSRFDREARLTAQLSHPGISAVYDVGTLSDGRPYFTMRLAPGDPLSTVIERAFHGGATATDMARLHRAVRQVVTTVAYAHGRGVVHASLHADDVLVDGQGMVTVLDWSAAVLMPQEGRSEPIDVPAELVGGTGSVRTMAPEQALGQQDCVAPCTDVFALGRLLFHSLTGVPAFAGDTDVEVLSRMLDGAYGTFADRPVALHLRTVCERSLLVDPGGRYANAAELCAALAPRPRRLASVVRIGVPTGTGYRDQILNVGESVTVSRISEMMGERLMGARTQDHVLIAPRGGGARLTCPEGASITCHDPGLDAGGAIALRSGESRMVGCGTQGELRFAYHTVLFQIGTLDFGAARESL